MRPFESDANNAIRHGTSQQSVTGATLLARDPINSAFAVTDAAVGMPADDRQASRPLAKGVATKLVHRIDNRSPEQANRQAVDDLANGADGFAVVFEGAANAFGQGLPANPDALAAALRDLPLGRLHLRVDAHPQSRASVDWIVQELTARRIAPERLDISFGIDPAVSFVSTGMLRMSIEALLASMPQSLAHFFVLGVPGILLEADGRVFHNAGADDALELGAALASTIGYLRMFEEARQPALYAAAHVGFAISVEQDRAAAAVKVAALGRLWDRLLDGYGVERIPLQVHVETSYRMITACDSGSNLARTTLAALGAIEAGASTVAALPADVAHRHQDDAAARQARVMQSTLLREAGGAREFSWHDQKFERAVERLCEAAWEELRTIESEGGILHSILAGHLQRRVIAARDAYAAMPVPAGSPAAPPIRSSAQHHAHARGRHPEVMSGGAIYCQRLEPVRWEELTAAEAA